MLKKEVLEKEVLEKEFKKIKGKGKENKISYHLAMKIWSSTNNIDFNINNGEWPSFFIEDKRKEKEIKI